MAKRSNEQLVQRFENYLEKASQCQDKPAEKIDLFSFYSEIIALKNEVKIESRLIKQGLDDFKETAGSLQQGTAGLYSLLQESNKEHCSNVDISALQPVLLGLIDLYDRIQASLQTLAADRPAGLLSRLGFGRRSSYGKVVRSMREGQKMILERILDLLADCNVHSIKALGRRFDPQIMRAVGTDTLPEVEDGMVSAELRTGFTWNEEVLRPADVRVNRHVDATE